MQEQISLSDYVLQEAREKCFEIEVKAFKQFEKEKNIILEKEKAVIKDETDAKLRSKHQEEKIKHSALVNKCRLHKMQSRN
jgi:V-type H+-transporting ATPase subunit E